MQTDEQDGYPEHPMNRKGDQGVLAKMSELSIRFHWVSSLLVVIVGMWLTLFLALGFSFATPATKFAEMAIELSKMQREIDRDRTIDDSMFVIGAKRDDSGTQQLTYLQRLIEASVVVQCLDHQSKSASLNIRAAGLPCTRLLNERGLQ